MKKRGRRTNWEGIVEVIGRNVYGAMLRTEKLTSKAWPSREALVRLGKAMMHASADAARREKTHDVSRGSLE